MAVTIGGTLVTIPAAHAQSSPVEGAGNQFLVSGAGMPSGTHSQAFAYGDADDEVYFGDVVDVAGDRGGDGLDDAVVRRGNTFIVRGERSWTFSYGDPGDTVLVGDWDGDGTDTLAVRRGNVFFVKNTVSTGPA
ncbi:hypothetical protein A7K94_0218540, partial [Modestobacter sp. VKM Ac-2676]